VPLPWEGSAPPFGFSPEGVKPWLPQPESWAELTVEAQLKDPESMLNLYRRALRLRHEVAALQTDAFAWRVAPEGVLDFDRGPELRCVVNLSGEPFALGDAEMLVASVAIENGMLPHDSAAWLRASSGPVPRQPAPK
jgi:alpha-glucosidase